MNPRRDDGAGGRAGAPPAGEIGMESPLVAVLGARSAAPLAEKLDLHTVGDLVRYYPRRYIERGAMSDISELEVGEYVTVVARVWKSTLREMRTRRGFLLSVVIRDDRGGELDCTFFHGKRLQHMLTVGTRMLFAGTVEHSRARTTPRRLQLTHPDFEPLGEADEVRPFLSVYPTRAGLPSWLIANCARQALAMLSEPADPLPAAIRRSRRLAELGSALRKIHVPQSVADFQSARARLVWDEAFGVQLALALQRERAMERPAPACPHRPGGLLDDFEAILPFALTEGQRAVGAEIAADLARTQPMNRLVQGDVGAGKTVVALRAMLQVVDAGRQAAMLAPTEVLATQHARSLRAMLGPLGQGGELGSAEQATTITLLTGSMGAGERRRALEALRSGEAGIIVGTHALIQDAVDFADLGLVVVDEQHRFGVEQRDALRGRAEHTPHLLVMTATPIPRTVAMTVYGDLEVSALTELPKGRSPISTTVVPIGEKPAWFERVWARVREEVAAGHQAYVVCPRVGGEEPKKRAGAAEEQRPPLAVLDVAPQLEAGQLAGLRLGILHGRLPPDDKERVMRAFDAGELDVLVATTVIEVGVDVPNATAMVILDADRFGLSQLHQLRGRVGRGSAPGVCLLVTDVLAGTPTRERLDAVAATTDGFELARRDLELRREGDVLGSAQSGRRGGLKLLSLLEHEEVIVTARRHAAELVAEDPGLVRHPGLRALVDETLGEDQAVYLDKV